MSKRRNEGSEQPQTSKLFDRLENAVSLWIAQNADAHRGHTDQLARIREAVDKLADGATRQRDEATRTAQQLLADLHALHEADAAQSSSDEDAEHRIEQLEKTLEKRKESATADQQRIAQLERDLAERGEVSLAAQEAAKKLEAERDKERAEAQEAQRQVAELGRQLAEHGDATQAAQNRVAHLERELAKAQEAAAAVEQKAAELEQSALSLQNEAGAAAEARKQAEEARKRIEELEQVERDLNGRLVELSANGEAAEAARRRVAELEQVEGDLRSQLAGLVAANEAAETLRKQLSELEEADRGLKAQVAELESQVEKAKAEEESTTLDLEVTMTDLAKAREEVEALKEADRKAEDLRKLLEVERQRSEKLDRDLREERTKNAKSALAQQLAEALRECETMQEEVARLRRELDVLRSADASFPVIDEPPTERIQIPRNRNGQKRDFAEILIEAGVVTREQIAEVQKDPRKSPQQDLGALLVEKGLATEEIVAQARASAASVAFVRIEEETPDREAVALLSDRLAKIHACMPLRTEGNKLILAMANPLDLVAIEDIERTTNLTVAPVLATPSDVAQAVKQYYTTE